ncbi:pyrroline-5-carboxylate reductase [Leisingera aquimarina]|uniref:pyrroline-5-carboxylate reductase n=1 Tax=Leisingera aquimarina TaxID=476529 RepID=UPI0004269755|nr:pyrroline-5-carboxylate reductase [Leisingera aquimarina]
MKLGFIGTGVITEAIVRGLLRANYLASEILVSSRPLEISAGLAQLSPLVRVCEENQTIVDEAEMLFLAVRPQHAEDVLTSLTIGPDRQIVSLIATIPINRIREWTHPDAQICRAIPLPSVADLAGVTAIFPSAPKVEELFDALGTAVAARKIEAFDAYAVTSAMMGLYYGLSEAAAQWLCSPGTSCEGARAYLAGMFQGLADTATQASGESFEELRLRHTTPGGLNEQLFRTFLEQEGGNALNRSCDSVAKRIRGMH